MKLEKALLLGKEVLEREIQKLGKERLDNLKSQVEVETIPIESGGLEVTTKFEPETDLETTCLLNLTDDEKVAVCVHNSIYCHVSGFTEVPDPTVIIDVKKVIEEFVKSGIVEGAAVMPCFMYKGKILTIVSMKLHDDIQESIKKIREKNNIILYQVNKNKYGTIIRFAYVK